MKPLLEVENLTVAIQRQNQLLYPAYRVQFEVEVGEFVGIVGESGSGKTVTILSLLGLENFYPGVIGGQVRFRFRDGEVSILDRLDDFVRFQNGMPHKNVIGWRRSIHRISRNLLGRKVAIILQDSQKTLNPFLKIHQHLREMILHNVETARQPQNPPGRPLSLMSFVRRQQPAFDTPVSPVALDAVQEEAIRLLRRVQFREPMRVMNAYPHELSGGMCQRISIALALATRPEFLVLDEPTTGLDVTLQASLTDLLFEIRQRESMSGIVISHDLPFISRITDRVVVMFSGEIWEIGPVKEIMHPEFPWKHPYTRFLLQSATSHQGARNGVFVPRLEQRKRKGCILRAECPLYRQVKKAAFRKKCDTRWPEFFQVYPRHHIRCWAFENEGSVK
ncbi:MAG: ABC transporter ATP-binding protein [Calditrichaeota bacterium]|nr:ABC transporter ATP-binding protein [Calditrichota bacterium]